MQIPCEERRLFARRRSQMRSALIGQFLTPLFWSEEFISSQSSVWIKILGSAGRINSACLTGPIIFLRDLFWNAALIFFDSSNVHLYSLAIPVILLDFAFTTTTLISFPVSSVFYDYNNSIALILVASWLNFVTDFAVQIEVWWLPSSSLHLPSCIKIIPELYLFPLHICNLR